MKFSIIVPVYNVSAYLPACLDSILSAAKMAKDSSALQPSTSNLQPLVEVICVDDGSTDGSGAILDDYQRKVDSSVQPSTSNLQPVFKVIHQANAGVSAARNRGLEVATGDWLLFVDADDVVRDTLFSDLTALHAMLPDVELLGFGQLTFSGNDGALSWKQKEEWRIGVRELDLKFRIPDILARMSAYRFAYRADRFGDIRFPPYTRGEDLVYVARVLARAENSAYLTRDEYGYRNRPASAVHADLSAEILRETVSFHAEMFRTLTVSGKSLGPRLWQLRIEQWILRLPTFITGHGRDPAWLQVWETWRDSMALAVTLPMVTGTCRCIAKIAVRCPFQVPVMLACRMSLRLLRLHRAWLRNGIAFCDAASVIQEIETVAHSLRGLRSAGGDAMAEKRLAKALFVDLPRLIRSLPSERPAAARVWRLQVLTFAPGKMPFLIAMRLRLLRWRLVKVPRLIEKLAYWTGIMAVFRYLNRRVKRVLTFHNVLPDALCTRDLAGLTTMPASIFENMIKHLITRYRFSSDFDDDSTLTITFDDGYRCQFETAGDILGRYGIPAVVFVSGNTINADVPQRALVVDRLMLWTSCAPLEALASFAGVRCSSREAFWYETMEPAFRNDAAQRGEGVFRRADAIWPFERIVDGLDPEMVRLRMTGPDVALVSRRRAEGWKIGWHTQSHFPLAFMSAADAECELTPTDAACLEIPVSYPYGTPVAVLSRDERICSRIGFPGGYSNLDCNNLRVGAFFRPRITLTGNRIEDESQLSGFRHFMETGRLLRKISFEKDR